MIEPKAIDLRGLQCPEPRKRAQFELDLIKEGTLIFLLESPAVWNVERFARKSGLMVERVKHKDYYELTIIKTPYIRPAKDNFLKRMIKLFGKNESCAEEESADGLSNAILVISTDVLGRDADIGVVLMKAFLETLKVTKEVPGMIFFLNAGVKLTTVSEEIIQTLKELEEMGVEIFSCGTCLKHYNLESELKVGYRGATSNIIEGMADYKKAVWI